MYKAVVPNNPRRNNNFLLLPTHETHSLYNPANPISVATEHLKKTNSIAGRCANFFTITFINENQNVERNLFDKKKLKGKLINTLSKSLMMDNQSFEHYVRIILFNFARN